MSRKLIDIIDAATGESLMGKSDRASIEHMWTIYEDRKPDLGDLISRKDHRALAGLISSRADLLLLGSVTEQSTGLPMRYVQYWRRVDG